MKRLTLRNKKLISTLQDITDYVFHSNMRPEIEKGVKHRREGKIAHQGYSDQYLQEAMKRPLKEFGYPLDINGMEIKYIPNAKLFEDISNKVNELNDILGFGYNSLCCYYPEEGYIGWHHNGNAPGFNILFTYSPTGEGWLKYYDLKNKKIVMMEDKPGWSVKVGYYGRDDTVPGRAEYDKIFWHSAYTKVPRLTVSFVLNHNSMWNDVIDEIESE